MKIHSVESACKEITDTIESEAVDVDICNTIEESIDSNGYEEGNNNSSCNCKYPLQSVALKSQKFAVSKENQVRDDGLINQVDSASLAFEGKMSELDVDEPTSDDGLSNMSLETFVVGRRFADDAVVNLGAEILLLRDPENVKDPNSIKVFPLFLNFYCFLSFFPFFFGVYLPISSALSQVLVADSRCGEVLGFLPRELAQHLSPLVDKFQLCFEVFEHSIWNYSALLFCFSVWL